MASSDTGAGSSTRPPYSSSEGPAPKKARSDNKQSVSASAIRSGSSRNALAENCLFSVRRWRGRIYHNLHVPIYYQFKEPCSIVLGKTQRHLSLKHISAVDVEQLNLLQGQHIERAASVMAIPADKVQITDSLYLTMVDRFRWLAPDGRPTAIPLGIVWGWPTVVLRGTCFGNNVYQSVLWVSEAQQTAGGGENKENEAPIEEASNGGGDAFAVHEWVPRADGEEWMRTNNPQEREYYYRQWAQE